MPVRSLALLQLVNRSAPKLRANDDDSVRICESH